MAVYTHLGLEEILDFLNRYDLEPLTAFHGIREGVENTNYLLVTERRRLILTIYEKRVAPEDLPFFLGLMDHLAGKGFPCPVPLRDREGRALQRIHGKPAAIVTFLEGRSPRRITRERCNALGRILARLHLDGLDFDIRRENGLAVPALRPLFESSAARADEVEPGLGEELARELETLEQNWPGGLPAGVIHADLFPDNVFFERDEVTGVIDFYFACNDLLAYDLAICMNAWCFEQFAEFNITKARALLRGYRQVRSLSAAELEALPILARGAAMRFLLTRLHDWLHQVEGALVQPKNPLEYVRKLRFHRGIRGPAAYGLD